MSSWVTSDPFFWPDNIERGIMCIKNGMTTAIIHAFRIDVEYFSKLSFWPFVALLIYI